MVPRDHGTQGKWQGFRIQNEAQQSGPGYDPQAAVMRWLPLATIAILTPGGSILTRDVQLVNTICEGDSMITKCPNCSALLDCPQEPGSNVDCAGCGNPFIAQPIPPENTPSAVNHASGDKSSSKKQRALNAIDQQIRQHEKIKRQKEIEQQDRLAAAERRKIEALRLGEKKYEDALAVAKISRGSLASHSDS